MRVFVNSCYDSSAAKWKSVGGCCFVLFCFILRGFFGFFLFFRFGFWGVFGGVGFFGGEEGDYTLFLGAGTVNKSLQTVLFRWTSKTNTRMQSLKCKMVCVFFLLLIFPIIYPCNFPLPNPHPLCWLLHWPLSQHFCFSLESLFIFREI